MSNTSDTILIVQTERKEIRADRVPGDPSNENGERVLYSIEQGLPGSPGKSAFQLAVVGGFVGTEEEWLASLQAAVGGISTDEGNALTKGTDQGLYVPDLVADPVAYYILAKS